MFAGRLARGADVVEVSKAALAGPAPHRPPRPTDLLLQGMATLLIDGHAAAAPIFKAALSAFRERGRPTARGVALALVRRAAPRGTSGTRRAGGCSPRESSSVPVTPAPSRPCRCSSARSAALHVLCGELSAAESLLDESGRPPRRPASPLIVYVEIWLAALRGREPELSALVEDLTTDAKARGEGFALAFAGQAGAVLYNGLGRYEEAFAAVREAVDVAPYPS